MTEDLPQIVLAISVARNVKKLISWVQIAKAVYGVIDEPLLRLKKNGNDVDRSRRSFRATFPCYECLKFLDASSCILLWFFSVILLVILLSAYQPNKTLFLDVDIHSCRLPYVYMSFYQSSFFSQFV